MPIETPLLQAEAIYTVFLALLHKKILLGVLKLASEAVGPTARLGYSWQGSRPSNRLG
jgi:hypothetical protein